MAGDASTRFMLRAQAGLSNRFNIDIQRPSSGKSSVLGEIIHTIQDSKNKYDRFKYGTDILFLNIKTKLEELQKLINNKKSPETLESKAREIIELRKEATDRELKRLQELVKLNYIYEQQRSLYDKYKEKKN